MIYVSVSRLQLITFGGLYLCQGILDGFILLTLTAHLVAKGLPISAIAPMLALSKLPWAFKWLWGLLIDRYEFAPLGRRRGWLLLAQGTMVVVLLGIIPFGQPEAGLTQLGWLLFLLNLAITLQDTATDALAIDQTGNAIRGKINGVMWASRYGGIALGGTVLGTLTAAWGLGPSLFFLAILVFAVLVWLLWWVEEPSKPRGLDYVDQTQSIRLKALWLTLAQPARVPGVLLALWVQLPVGLLTVFAPVLLERRQGWTALEYAQTSGVTTLVGGISGALLGGWFVDRYGVKSVLTASIIGLSLQGFLCSLTSPWWGERSLIFVLLLVFSFFVTVLSVGLASLFMDLSNSSSSATQFSLYMALINFSFATGQGLSGWLYPDLNFQNLYALAAFLQLTSLVPLFWLKLETQNKDVP